MPSGAKKRKAAKKKKEMVANINSSANGPQEDEGVKSQDGKSGGSEEANAPTLYHHHNCHNPLNGSVGEFEKNETTSLESIVVEAESLCVERIQRNEETKHELGFEGNCAVEVVNELISTENYDRSISIEYIETGNKFDGRDGENLTSSSDDQDSIPDEKIEEYTSFYKTNSSDDKPDNFLAADAIRMNKIMTVGDWENINSLVEPAMVADSVKSDVFLPKETICLTKVAAVENTVVSDIVASQLKEGADKLSNPGDRTRDSVTHPDSVPKVNEDKVLALSGEDCLFSSGVMEHGSKYLEGKTCLSSEALVIDAGKSDAIGNDSEIAKYDKNQTLASAPLVAQRTSLFSCCGLFDLLKGSNR